MFHKVLMRMSSCGYSVNSSQFYLLLIFYFNVFIILFIYFWRRWVFVAARGLSLVVVSVGYSSLWCAGFSLRWLLVAEHGL